MPPLRDRDADIPLLAEHFMAELAREYGRRPKRLDPGRGDRACAATLAGQRARAAQRDRAADDHGAGRHDHARRSGVPRTARSMAAAETRRARRRCRCTTRASGSSATTSCARSPRSRATCRGPRKPSASSEATCIGRCARSASCRRARGRASEGVGLDRSFDGFAIGRYRLQFVLQNLIAVRTARAAGRTPPPTTSAADGTSPTISLSRIDTP